MAPQQVRFPKYVLLDLYRPKLERETRCTKAIPVQIQLLSTQRFLATGTFQREMGHNQQFCRQCWTRKFSWHQTIFSYLTVIHMGRNSNKHFMPSLDFRTQLKPNTSQKTQPHSKSINVNSKKFWFFFHQPADNLWCKPVAAKQCCLVAWRNTTHSSCRMALWVCISTQKLLKLARSLVSIKICFQMLEFTGLIAFFKNIFRQLKVSTKTMTKDTWL